MYYALLMTVVKLGGQANAGIAASLKLLRAILNLGSHLLSLFSQSGKGLEFTVLGALMWEGKEE